MRVVIINPRAQLGGAERSLLTFLKAAQGHGCQATVILPRPGPLGEFLSRLGVPWQVIPMPAALLSQSRQKRRHFLGTINRLTFQGAAYLARLAGAIRRLQPEVLYTNGIKSNIIGGLLRPLVGARLVWHWRDAWSGVMVGLLADLAPDVIIANSRFTAAIMQRHMRRPTKVTVIPNAVDLEEFSPGGPRVSLKAYPCGHTVGLVAAFSRLKGHRLLLEAAGKILAEFPSTCFFFIGGSIYDTVGDNGYEEEVRRLVQERDLGERVIFTGFKEAMAPWYRALDVVVSCSVIPESFGRTLLEAMACGTAVVGPHAGGIPEFVEHGRNGLLYEMGNPDSLAKAILALLRDPELRKRLEKSGRDTVVREFALKPDGAAILSCLKRLT